MKTYGIVTILASAAVALIIGCEGPDAPSSSTAASGGSGGASSAATTGSSGGAGGDGGAGGSMATGTGGMGGGDGGCVIDAECSDLNDPLLPCWIGKCVDGACDRTPLALWTPCDDHNKAMVCDGMGACRELFSYGSQPFGVAIQAP